MGMLYIWFFQDMVYHNFLKYVFQHIIPLMSSIHYLNFIAYPINRTAVLQGLKEFLGQTWGR